MKKKYTPDDKFVQAINHIGTEGYWRLNDWTLINLAIWHSSWIHAFELKMDGMLLDYRPASILGLPVEVDNAQGDTMITLQGKDSEYTFSVEGMGL